MQGTLDDFPLPDIIQLISLSKKTGAVEIQSSDGYGPGRIYFVQGRIAGAQLADLPALEAFYTFFTFPGGQFQFYDSVPTPPGEPFTRSNEYLLIEGIGRAEEWQKLRASLPPPDAVLSLVADPAASTDEIALTQEDWRVLTLINNRDTLVQLAGRAGLSPYQTGRVLARLLGAGLVQAQAPAPAARGQGAVGQGFGPGVARRPALPDGQDLYRRLERAASGSLGNTGRRVLEDAYRRLRLTPGSDLDATTAGTLCDQFERAASLLVGPGRARTLADTLRRTAAEFYAA